MKNTNHFAILILCITIAVAGLCVGKYHTGNQIDIVMGLPILFGTLAVILTARPFLSNNSKTNIS